MGWFEPRCPVDAESKGWIEGRMAWLVDQFGWDRLLDAPVVLPTEEFFPGPYHGSEEDARRLLDRVAVYMDADPAHVDLQLYSGREPAGLNINVEGAESLGLHEEQQGKTKIRLEASQLREAGSAVATLAHELGHALLLGQRRVTPEEEDHEPLTDLLNVFLGLGIVAANAVLRSESYHAGNWEAWSVSGRGYLTARMFGYALALFAWLRGESNPAWSKSLRADVRKPFRDALRYLSKTGDSSITRRGELIPSKSHDRPACAFTCPACPSSTTDESRGEERKPGEPADLEEFKTETADDYFTRGTIHLKNDHLDHALADFSEAVRLAPDDAECYQQRALVYLRMNRPDEALADAEQAVRLDPDEIEFYHARGIAYVGVHQYGPAIEDLDCFICEERFARGVESYLVEAYFFRGLALAGLGQWRRAIADQTRAINLAPRFAEAYAARGLAYHRLGKNAKADADREKALRLSSPTADGE